VRTLCAISGWSSGPVRSVVWWEWSCEKGLPAQGDLHSLCRSGEKGLGAAALLATYGTLFTVLYLAWPHPILHQVMYGVLVFYMIYQAMMILKEGYNKVSMKLFVLGILMYGCGFLLWNLGDYSTLIKFKSFHAPQKTSSVTMWKLCEVPCLHCWLQLLSSMAGGICVQVMQPT